MPIDYLPILVLLTISFVFAIIALLVPSLLGPHKPEKHKLFTYEAGKIPFGSPWGKPFSVKYYLTAVLFILFDIEVVFLYPWAVLLRKLRLFGLVEMAIFILILLVGYYYVWRKGAFEWD
ncbi:MAG: NADH-quinone oxidoreductase subunit A [Anaerolineae bacterium]|nr:NADH-quinone oxidoreductase subunit A [Anaerolineae bacterium]